MDDVSWSATISARREGKQWVATYRWLQEMERHLLTLSVVSWSTDISACGENTQWEGALRLQQEMV